MADVTFTEEDFAPTFSESDFEKKPLLPDLSNVDIPAPSAPRRGPPIRAELAQATPIGKEGLFEPFVPLGTDIQAQTLPGQLLAAPYNLGKGILEGAESKGGLLALPFGATGKLAQTALGAGFGLPAMWQGAQRVYKGTALEDPQEALEGALQVLTGGLITGGALHGATTPETITPKVEPSTPIEIPPVIAPPKISEVQQTPPSVVAAGESPTAPAVSAAGSPVAAGEVPATVEPTPIRTTTQEGLQSPHQTIKDAWEGYDELDTLKTPRDLANAIDALPEDVHVPKYLSNALQSYKDSIEEDFTEYAGRGDVEGPEERFLAAVEKAASSKPKKVKPTATTPTIGQAEMGAAGIEEKAVQPTGTGLKNAIGEMERVGLGLQDAPENVQRNMAAAWQRSAQVETAAPGSGKTLADSLIANPERGLTDADSALLLRHKTDLFNRLNDAAEKTHTGDEASRKVAQTQYNDLLQQYGDLLDAVNKRGSEWGREGRWRQAMAREDFTFTSTDQMHRYRRALTGEDLPRDKVPQADKISKDVKDATDQSNKAQQAVVEDLKNKVQVPPRLTMTQAEKQAFDAVSRVMRNQGVMMANAAVKDRIAKAKTVQDLYQIQKDFAQDALNAADKRARAVAADAAKAEAAMRVAKTAKDRELAKIQRDAAKKAMAEVDKQARKAATDVAQAERKLQSDPIKAVWTKVREYIDKGEDDPNQIRNKVATDLGMTTDRVTRLMARDAKTKRLMDDAWRKQQLANTMRQNARTWVRNLDIPNYEKAIASIPRAMFGLKVGFHGTVALGTHAPTVAFQPRFWGAYVRNFGKMYKMVADPAYYERQAQDLVRRKNYIKARRGGLVNDPGVFEDFTSPETAKYFGNITGMGNRGYSVLKILRQDMFDQMYDQLPRSLQVQDGVVQALADQINHATGVVKGYAPRGTNLALFAPRLEASRVMQLAGDPIRAGRTTVKRLLGGYATEGEKLFARNQLKEKLWIFGTLASALALNQGFLQAIGSKQKINGVPQILGGAGFDPMSSDFLKFKVGGYDVAYGSALWNLAKLPIRAGTALAYHGKGSKLVLEDERVGKVLQDYARSQASPFAGTTADLFLGRDYAGRPLPRAGFGLLPGRTDIPKRLRLTGTTEPYTWKEYLAQQFSPIPVSEGLREVWKDGLGMSDEQINSYIKAFGVSLAMSGSGTRITQDKRIEKEQ